MHSSGTVGGCRLPRIYYLYLGTHAPAPYHNTIGVLVHRERLFSVHANKDNALAGYCDPNALSIDPFLCVTSFHPDAIYQMLRGMQPWVSGHKAWDMYTWAALGSHDNAATWASGHSLKSQREIWLRKMIEESSTPSLEQLLV